MLFLVKDGKHTLHLPENFHLVLLSSAWAWASDSEESKATDGGSCCDLHCSPHSEKANSSLQFLLRVQKCWGQTLKRVQSSHEHREPTSLCLLQLTLLRPVLGMPFSVLLGLRHKALFGFLKYAKHVPTSCSVSSAQFPLPYISTQPNSSGLCLKVHGLA